MNKKTKWSTRQSVADSHARYQTEKVGTPLPGGIFLSQVREKVIPLCRYASQATQKCSRVRI